MNNFKRILAVLMVLATVFAFVACAGSNDTPTNPSSSSSNPSNSSSSSSSSSTTSQPPVDESTLRITVVDEKGNPVAGIGVQLCKADGTCTTKDTNEDGIVGFSNEAAGGYDGYTLNIAYQMLDDVNVATISSAKEQVPTGAKEVTLTLKVTYRVKVVDAEGKPVACEAVTLVNASMYEHVCVLTNEEGYAEFVSEVKADAYVAYLGNFFPYGTAIPEGTVQVAIEGESLEATLVKG